MWKAEALWEARVSPWRPLADVSDDELRAVLDAAHRLMRASRRRARGRCATSTAAPAGRARAAARSSARAAGRATRAPRTGARAAR